MRRPLALLLVLAAACGRDKQTPDLGSRDSALARDLTLAGHADSVQPQLRDVPMQPAASPAAAPEPVRRVEHKAARRPEPRVVRHEPARTVAAPPPVVTPAPSATTVAAAPAAAPPAPRTGTISRGTSFDLSSDSRVCTTSARPGDKMVARLASAVTGSNGALFPAGSQAVVEIAEVAPDGAGTPIAFRVKSVIVDGVTYAVSGSAVPTGTLERKRVEGETSDKKKVIGGAIAGAILGQMIGHHPKSTIIGAAAGGAAGAAAAAAGAKYESCLPAGSPLRATLTDNVEVTLKS